MPVACELHVYAFFPLWPQSAHAVYNSANTALLQQRQINAVMSSGYFYAVVSHEADLARLQHVVTTSSQHDGSPLPDLVVVIDKMRLVNSPTSHKQLLELFHLTRVRHALLPLMHCSLYCFCHLSEIPSNQQTDQLCIGIVRPLTGIRYAMQTVVLTVMTLLNSFKVNSSWNTWCEDTLMFDLVSHWA